MTRIQFNLYKKALDDKAEALSTRPGFRDEITVERAPDTLDALREAVDRDLAILTLNQQAAEFAEIRCALDRIAEGSFGRCLECDEPIPEKRLNAVPWAAYCVKCQKLVDHASQYEEAFIQVAG